MRKRITGKNTNENKSQLKNSFLLISLYLIDYYREINEIF